MTTQVLIHPLSVIMGDNNSSDAIRSTTNPLLAVCEGEDAFGFGGVGGRGSAPPASTASPTLPLASDSSATAAAGLPLLAETTTEHKPGEDGGGEDSKPATLSLSSSSTGLSESFPAAASGLSNTMPSSASFATMASGRETGIVSHLRRSSSSGSYRQDIETALRARGGNVDASLSLAANPAAAASIANFSSSMMVTHPDSSSNNYGTVMSPGGNMSNNNSMNPNNNNLMTAAAAAAGNPFAAALFLQSQMHQIAAMNSNKNSNAMIMPHPNMFMAGGFGMGNFGNLAAAFANGKPSSVLHPRLGGALLGGSVAMPQSTTKRKPLSLYMDCDTESLSEYQCLIRQQIELFEADKLEASSSVQGRNKQIVEGQVGIRCRHCAFLPPRQRQKGSMYFPTKLERIYQAAQNLSTFHLCDNCKHVPENVRKRILLLRERKSPAGGGKRYWGEGVRCLGVVEDQNGMRFR
jgi:hypothetical protein